MPAKASSLALKASRASLAPTGFGYGDGYGYGYGYGIGIGFGFRYSSTFTQLTG
ncbi:hypothetical protein PS838_03532 [Pseudomonas fluorescens]|nr:hypothetical protein PS838_03532 [Pseudomonas fluorescens]